MTLFFEKPESALKNSKIQNQKVAVVTGGLGQLGAQFVEALVNDGKKVAILDVGDNIIKQTKIFITSGAAKVYKCNITSRTEVENCLYNIKNDFGRPPSILVNNAAIDSPPDSPQIENGPFEQYPIDSLNRLMNVNVNGSFICCQVFGNEMVNNGWGRIINICSIYGMGSPIQDIYKYKNIDNKKWFKPAAYGMSKASLLNLTKYLATYWAKAGVCVNAISPAGIFNNQDNDFLEEYTKRVPIGRMANDDEINSAILFLSSEAASYITGANLVVDGGWTSW